MEIVIKQLKSFSIFECFVVISQRSSTHDDSRSLDSWIESERLANWTGAERLIFQGIIRKAMQIRMTRAASAGTVKTP